MRFVKGERTFETAIEEAKTPEARLSLLEPFLKVCDTVAYAHSKGVVHRDLKPANVALGGFGEVVILDWGLAKLRDRPDLSGSSWKERIEEIRVTEDLKTLAGGLGTPGYMAPEALFGEASEVDERSDVYSLGAILYKSLTGRLPHEFASFPEFVTKLLEREPPPPHEAAPGVPEGLSRICAAALSRDKGARPKSAQELSRRVRAWQAENAVEREVHALLQDAKAAWADAGSLHGEELLSAIDRVLSRTNRALQLRPRQWEAQGLAEKATAARSAAIAGRERAARRGLLKRVAVVGLVLALAASGVVAALLDGKRREAEAAERRATAERDRAESERARAEAEKDAKQRALSDVLRLSDVKRARDLVAEAEELWPVHPDKAPAMEAWLARAEELLGGRAGHEATLAALRARALAYTEEERRKDHAAELSEIEAKRAEAASLVEDPAATEEERKARAERSEGLEKAIEALEAKVRERGSWRFADPGEAWQHEVLSELVSNCARLAEGEGSATARVAARLEAARGLVAATVNAHEGEWSEAVAAIADETRCPVYRGLRIGPIAGLVPLGKDPDSGLFEFAHAGSGTVPVRDPETGKLAYEDDAAIVLVLIPGGTFLMGAQRGDPAGPNYDPQAESDEGPPRTVTVPAFFLGKHECTQAQWAALAEGQRPSNYGAGGQFGGKAVTDRNPVEQVDWTDADRWLTRHRLRLPSEAEWEFACRAGAATPWWTGREAGSLQGAANIADAWCKGHGGPPDWRYTEEVDDGHTVHAPVGSYRPNAFGLHDMAGNVYEWCADWYGSYGETPRDGTARLRQGASPYRVLRGGGWSSTAVFARSALRLRFSPARRYPDLGLRPAASVH